MRQSDLGRPESVRSQPIIRIYRSQRPIPAESTGFRASDQDVIRFQKHSGETRPEVQRRHG